MTPDAVRAHLRETLAAIAPEADLDAVGPSEPLREALDLDSMDFLRWLQSLSERLGVEVPERDYPQCATVDGMIAWFADHVP